MKKRKGGGPGGITLPGGTREGSEDPTATAIREVLEEVVCSPLLMEHLSASIRASPPTTARFVLRGRTHITSVFATHCGPRAVAFSERAHREEIDERSARMYSLKEIQADMQDGRAELAVAITEAARLYVAKCVSLISTPAGLPSPPPSPPSQSSPRDTGGFKMMFIPCGDESPLPPPALTRATSACSLCHTEALPVDSVVASVSQDSCALQYCKRCHKSWRCKRVPPERHELCRQCAELPRASSSYAS